MNPKSHHKNTGLRATSVELFSREISVSSSDTKVLSRDADNLYPLRIERIINNSPTARRCVNMMAKFISGRGTENDVIVNRKGETINDIIDQSANYIAEQNGVYYLVKYAFDTDDIGGLYIASIEVLDYVSMAKSKKDDNGYSGKYYCLETDAKSGAFKKATEDTRWFYPFSNDRNVILSQMENDCRIKGISNPTGEDLIRNYRGQVYYLNMTPKYEYALPLVDVVYNDCDTEYRLSLYNNTQTRKGFLGQLVVTKYKELEQNGDERKSGDLDEFNEHIKMSLGAENSANVLVVEIPFGSTENLNDAFIVKQFNAQFDDKLFTQLEKSLERKIMKAFNNIPEALVNSGSGALFGTNEGVYEQMKQFYWEQNDRERRTLERTLRLFGYDVTIRGF